MTRATPVRENIIRYEMLFKHNVAGMFRSSMDGRILQTNAAFERIFAFGVKRRGSVRLGKLLGTESAEALVTAVRAKGTVTGVKSMAFRSDGQPFRIVLNASLVSPPSGRRAEIEASLVELPANKGSETRFPADNVRRNGRLVAAQVAHDFRNLLMAIDSYNRHLLERLGHDARVRQALEGICKASECAAALSGQLMALGARDAPAPKPVSIDQAVSGLIPAATRILAEGVRLEFNSGAPTARILALPGQLEQVLLNLLLNAGDAMPNGGTISVSTAPITTPASGKSRPAGASGWVGLTVRDTGQGMDRATLERITEPFFSTKGAGRGLGMAGLERIVRQIGGKIRIESEPGKGTTIQVLLPYTDRKAAPGATPETESSGACASCRILAVEDDPTLRAVVGQILRSEGHSVVEAGSVPEALRIYETTPEGFQLLVTDATLQGGTGSELACSLQSKQLNLKVLMMSGFGRSAMVSPRARSERWPLLMKPFRPLELVGAVRKLLGSSAASERIMPYTRGAPTRDSRTR